MAVALNKSVIKAVNFLELKLAVFRVAENMSAARSSDVYSKIVFHLFESTSFS